MKSRVFVALLYGSRPEFLVCACLVGQRLQRFCPNDCDRVLLLTSDCAFLKAKTLRVLRQFWKIRIVQAISMTNATKTKRHELAFTKLHALSVKAQKIVFLDLDILVRSERVTELFDVEAPAGMYHGRDGSTCNLHHGSVIDSGALSAGCVNTGVLRVDPPETQQQRNALTIDLKKQAARIPKSEATFLPEQYFLAQKLPGPWRHISPIWNWEVGPDIEITPQRICFHKIGAWSDIKFQDIVIVHFSGLRILPWHYMDLSLDEVKQAVQQRLGWQDTKGRVAQAVSEWCSAVHGLFTLACDNAFGSETKARDWKLVRSVLRVAIEQLRTSAQTNREWLSSTCSKCALSRMETFFWRQSEWWCAGCVLRYHQLRIETLTEGNTFTLNGRWLDNRRSDCCAEVSHALRVQFNGWAGQIHLGEQDSIHIAWDEGGWRSVGTLRGALIAWRNGSEWVRITST